MAAQYWRSLLTPAYEASAAAYASSATIADVSPLPTAVVCQANTLRTGSKLHCVGYGTFSNTATPTLILGVYYGGVAGVSLGATAATTTTTAATNWPWRLEFTATVRSSGATGTAVGQGFVDLATSLTAVTRIPIPSIALAAITIDTTAAKALTIGATWGTLSASNTLTCFDWVVEQSN